MPKVSSDIISSIREQTYRSKQRPYCMDVLDEMKSENPDIHEAILSSVKAIAVSMKLDLMNEVHYNHMLNMLNVATSVYQCIKQQMIVDELEDSFT
jgi:hypothetical protein